MPIVEFWLVTVDWELQVMTVDGVAVVTLSLEILSVSTHILLTVETWVF